MSTKRWYARKDANGFPTPGTLQAFDTSSTAKGLVEVENIEKSVELNETEVKHANGFRYFVRVDAQGNIQPNSLITTKKRPAGKVIEFKQIIPA